MNFTYNTNKKDNKLNEKFYLDDDINKIINNSFKELNKFDERHILLTGGNGFLENILRRPFILSIKFIIKKLN